MIRFAIIDRAGRFYAGTDFQEAFAGRSPIVFEGHKPEADRPAWPAHIFRREKDAAACLAWLGGEDLCVVPVGACWAGFRPEEALP